MAALFSKPKAPTIVQQVAPPTPTIDQAARQDELARKFARRRGRVATVHGGRNAGAASPQVAVKTALG